MSSKLNLEKMALGLNLRLALHCTSGFSFPQWQDLELSHCDGMRECSPAIMGCGYKRGSYYSISCLTFLN